jgi:hypothetical protein
MQRFGVVGGEKRLPRSALPGGLVQEGRPPHVHGALGRAVGVELMGRKPAVDAALLGLRPRARSGVRSRQRGGGLGRRRRRRRDTPLLTGGEDEKEEGRGAHGRLFFQVYSPGGRRDGESLRGGAARPPC